MQIKNIEKFKNRTHAGELLGCKLDGYLQHNDALVLALPRGGAQVGYTVARELHLPLDILLVHKICLPGNEEYAIGAISSDGICILRKEAINVLEISNNFIENAAGKELRELELREQWYRKERRPLQLKERIVILVDDGVTTGATMEVAAHVVREANPARLIIAVPVATSEVCRKLRLKADEIVCLQMPERFSAVGEWYEDFVQTSDEEVKALLTLCDEYEKNIEERIESNCDRQSKILNKMNI
jgi:putative phosphoribosyl transferase